MVKIILFKIIITMNISELFNKLHENVILEQLKGEFQLQSNCIIWTYDLNNDSEEIEAPSNENEESEDSFEALSSKELLQEAYDEDIKTVYEFLDELDEYDNWTISEPEFTETMISFKIF